MKLLVTGATGFVGQATVARLVECGHEVVAALRRPGAAPTGASAIVTGAIETADWRTALEGVEGVIHLAARVHRMRDRSADPLAAFRETNRDATLRLAEAAAGAGVARFVFLSSVKAALERTGLDPADETIAPAPQSPYGISKLEAERGLMGIAGLAPVILRPPLVYGPGAKGNLRSLFRLARLGLPLPLGGIRNRRSLIGVGNLAAAIEHALSLDGAADPVFFVEDVTLSTPDLLRAAARAMGRRARLIDVPSALMRSLLAPLGQAARLERLTDSLAVGAGKLRATGWTPSIPPEVELERLARSLYPS